ncbi:ABC transporter permease subunit [Kitasatospora mediocidica]|uniref:ABC transporter permease subunit n=1 Tax=Kitasatospora mediocidica TaxID=58352 RepID=UPI00055CF79D|nr:ABC transporter permease subunit [Kitasatospora mediocidica]
MGGLTASAGQLRRPGPVRRVRAAVDSEWIKLRSVRGTWYALLTAAALMLLDSTVVCASINARWASLGSAAQLDFDPAARSLQGILLTQIFCGVTGVLVVGNEYSSGLIRTTLAATPQRGLLLAAKAVPLAVLSWVAGTAICFVSFLLGQAMLSGPAPHVSLGDPGALRAVLGGGTYLMLAALLGMGLAVIVRSTAAAVGALFGLLLILPILVGGLPHSLALDIGQYLPSSAGESMWHVVGAQGMLSPGAGCGVLVLFVAAVTAMATLRLRRSDA